MLLAAGLSPAWQQILVFERLAPGHVNRARTAQWCASGKVVNVGLAWQALGARSTMLVPIGGATGGALRADCEARGAAAEWLEVARPSRVCTTLLEEATGQTTELVENAGSLKAEELAAYTALYRQRSSVSTLAVLTGSLPAGTPTSFHRELLAATPCPALLDFRGPELLACLPLEPWLVKPNRAELAATVGRPLATEADLLDAMRGLVAAGARHVLATDGGGPVRLVSRDGAWRFEAPPLPGTVNPIGCGDCLAAGVAWAVAAGADLPDAVRIGMAAARQNAASLLPAHLVAAHLPSAAETIQIKPL